MVPPFAERASLDHYTRFSIPPIEEFRERDIVNFTHGYASPELLPADELTDAWNAVMAEHRDVAFQYGPAKGVKALRETLRDYLASDYGIDVGLEELSIVTGSKQGLDMLCKAFVEPGDTVIVTSPTYGTGTKIMKSHEVEFLEVPVGDDGLEVDVLREELERLDAAGEPLPKLAFTVPEFHNPFGSTMPLERREALLELAEAYDFLLVEDDPYRKLRFDGEEVPPLKSLDDSGQVVYLGTYSKLIAPGLRVGWMVGDEAVIERTLPMKEDGGTSALAQMLIRELHQTGYVSERASRYADHLHGQREATVEAIETHLPEARLAHLPAGGYYCWVELPGDVNTSELLEYARAEDVLYLPGEAFSPTGGNRDHLRISWAYENPGRIDEGLSRLATALERYRDAST
ncbi:MAG: PLP-dependent aminotransferase family protein [Halobacteriales archaeon]|nr:PLP-dependent aminotransferase family protein [Halobacteriales archaeon]